MRNGICQRSEHDADSQCDDQRKGKNRLYRKPAYQAGESSRGKHGNERYYPAGQDQLPERGRLRRAAAYHSMQESDQQPHKSSPDKA